jgi:hypothetical protein
MTRVLSAKPSKGRDASFSKTRSPAQNQQTNPYSKLFSLQRTAGNRAVEQMMYSGMVNLQGTDNSLSVSSLNQAPQIQCEKKSGLSPTTPRPDRDIEAQRLEAIDIVRSNCLKIWATAGKYGISAEAIAGAILWEALENPYHRSFSRLGPGKVHPTEIIGKSEAEKVEEEKRVPASKDKEERTQRLQRADQAITYIAAIMQRHADNYKKIAGVDITNNPGILCTLYQGGKSEERAQKLAEKRKKDPNAQPMPGDEMGPWVEQNMDFIKGLCTVGDFVPPSGSTRAA